jgi:hypothetical protein
MLNHPRDQFMLSHPVPTSSKDVRLPVQLQRAMAAEAEAAREARAKVNKLLFSFHLKAYLVAIIDYLLRTWCME